MPDEGRRGIRLRPPRRARFAERDEGQLMLLAGIVITISFILTSLTLAQVTSLERQAAQEDRLDLSDEWRFLHDRLGANLRVAVRPETTPDVFVNSTFPTVAATFRNIETEKGFDTVIRLANATSGFNKTEEDLVVGGHYAAWDIDGLLHFNWAYNGTDDGVVWTTACEAPEAPLAGCIQGVLVYVHMTDGQNAMEEVILFAVNMD